MKLKILGSGNIFSEDNYASYLIDNKILIDIPSGTCKTLKRLGINSRNIVDVLITHFHGDHYFDMPFMLLNKIYIDNNKLNIYCDDSGKDKIYDLTKLAFPNKLDKIYKYFNYDNSKNFCINDYEIERVLVEHEEGIESNGYIFKQNDIRVGFSGDAGMCEGIHIMAKKCNHLICDCTALNGKKFHIGVDNIIELSQTYKECIFYTTHMGDGVRDKIKSLGIKNLVALNDYDEFSF